MESSREGRVDVGAIQIVSMALDLLSRSRCHDRMVVDVGSSFAVFGGISGRSICDGLRKVSWRTDPISWRRRCDSGPAPLPPSQISDCCEESSWILGQDLLFVPVGRLHSSNVQLLEVVLGSSKDQFETGLSLSPEGNSSRLLSALSSVESKGRRIFEPDDRFEYIHSELSSRVGLDSAFGSSYSTNESRNEVRVLRVVCRDGYQHQLEYSSIEDFNSSDKPHLLDCPMGPHRLVFVEVNEHADASKGRGRYERT